MTKWELARYLIDAKKNIDSLLFVQLNIEKLTYLNIKERFDKIQMEFYLKLCYILDDVFKKNKKQICASNKVIKAIYDERDKNNAHKDKNYIPKNYQSWNEIITIMKEQIEEVRKVCFEKLPNVLTLDYVPHDKELFRFIYGINKEKEDQINNQKYTIYSNIENKTKINKKVFNDTEEIKTITDDERKDYAVLFKNGINFYEGIQERQDSCIKANVLFGLDVWCVYTDVLKVIEKLREKGLINEYDMPISYTKWDEQKANEFMKIIKDEGVINEES